MTKRLDHIEQLRGLAAFAVLGFHSLVTKEPNVLNPTLAAVRTVLIHGWLGVHVFFAISGWCIAQRITSARNRGETPWGYLYDRALRIYPTYWAALVFAVLMLAAEAPFNGIPLYRNSPHSIGVWLAEVTLTQPPFGYGSVLLVSWTLFYELTFYVTSAVALFLRRFHISGRTLLLIGGLVCPIFAWFPPTGFLLGLALWPHFFIGMLAWWYVFQKADGVWAASLISTLLALFTESFPGGQAEVALGTAFLLALAALHPPRLPPHVSRALTALGAASYSIYLIHVPVISPFLNLAARVVSPKSNAYVGVWIIGLAVAIAAGIVVHNVVEVPCERWRHRTLAARRADTPT
jgi:exopolysaccharide production protein ExoZ